MEAILPLLSVKTLKRLETGQALKLVGYGDSITAMGGGDVSPNGPMRDLKSYLNGLPADTLATIPTFDGDAGVGMHVRLGWNWLLKAALEERYSSPITYLNYGWGGTTSATGANNGLDPSRFGPVLAEGPALMVLAFGMNEIGSIGTYANIRSIIEQCQAVGTEVIVVTTPRVNSDGNPVSMVNWLKTHDYLVRAARDTGSAYVSLYELTGVGYEGAMGFSPRNLCSQNLYNHPWPKEFERIGALISSIFK
ncbi:SGNH/GDSL hydrolase family protein [Ochrobactrum tritici]|uniref:SGNH/GDSL hydrolase family protein n=1 Tax=Brucella tritici TaxID=94626 RepID=A0A7X6FQ13_9HYPH|nr:SGNH/GDSL hydrolase family protein [Brucella tritici]